MVTSFYPTFENSNSLSTILALFDLRTKMLWSFRTEYCDDDLSSHVDSTIAFWSFRHQKSLIFCMTVHKVQLGARRNLGADPLPSA